MITLALNCATDAVGLALLEEKEILTEFYLDSKTHRVEVVLPALDKLLLLSGIAMDQIDLFACTVGPGSFTGVRIGVSTVKGLALATGKPIVGVTTLEALAMGAFPSTGLICPIIDARRNQVYAGLYQMGEDGFPVHVTPDRLTDIEQLLRDLPAQEVDLIGDGALHYRKHFHESRTLRCDPSASRRHRIHASAVGLIGIERYFRGRTEDLMTFSPKYFRRFEEDTENSK